MSFSCELSELDLFAGSPVQTSILSSTNHFYSPITSLDKATVLEFLLPSNQQEYKDLNSAVLHMRLQFLTSDGAAYPSTKAENQQPGPVNNLLHSMIKSVSVYFNDSLVSFTDNVSYKDYIDKITTYSDDAEKSILINELFIKDISGPFSDAVDDKNLNLKTRRDYFKNSTIVDLAGRLNVDVLHLDKLLITGVDVKIQLVLQDPKFYIMEVDANKSTVKIHDCKLQVQSLSINPSIMMKHHQLLARGGKIRLPFYKSEVKSFTVASGSTSVCLDNIFTGILPEKVSIALVNNQAYTGSVAKNPFYFHHMALSSINLTVNNRSAMGRVVEMDFTNNRYAAAYLQFLASTGKLNSIHGSLISKSEWKRGFCINSFVLTPTKEMDNCLNLPLQGVVSCELKFDTALESTISVIVYSETPKSVIIDRSYNCSVE